MRLIRKTAWLALLPVVMLPGAGCSGINTSQGVSPATFLMPGFFGQTPPGPAMSPMPVALQESSQTFAHAK